MSHSFYECKSQHSDRHEKQKSIPFDTLNAKEKVKRKEAESEEVDYITVVFCSKLNDSLENSMKDRKCLTFNANMISYKSVDMATI